MKKIIIITLFALFSIAGCDPEENANLDIRISNLLPSGDGYLVTQFWLEGKEDGETTENLLPSGTALASGAIMEKLGPLTPGEYYFWVYFQGFQEHVSRNTVELFPGRNSVEIPPPSQMDTP